MHTWNHLHQQRQGVPLQCIHMTRLISIQTEIKSLSVHHSQHSHTTPTLPFTTTNIIPYILNRDAQPQWRSKLCSHDNPDKVQHLWRRCRSDSDCTFPRFSCHVDRRLRYFLLTWTLKSFVYCVLQTLFQRFLCICKRLHFFFNYILIDFLRSTEHFTCRYFTCVSIFFWFPHKVQQHVDRGLGLIDHKYKCESVIKL